LVLAAARPAKAPIQKSCALLKVRLLGDGPLTAASPKVGSKLPHHPPSRRDRNQNAPGQPVRQWPGSEIEQLQASLDDRWRQATRAFTMLLSAHGLPPA
jgi:hypothetical protein